MKKILLTTILLTITGCVTAPPKAHIPVTQSSAITLTSKSSEPLKLLEKMGASGIRDLNAKEFRQTQKDREKFEESIGAREGFNRTAYEMGGVGLGMAGGLSFGSVLGFAALTSLTADDTPDNYVFAWDFDGKARVFNKSGNVDTTVLNKAIAEGISLFSNAYPEAFNFKGDITITDAPEGYVYTFDKTGKPGKEWYYNEKHKRKSKYYEPHYFSARGSASLPKQRTLYFSVTSYCDGKSNGCVIKATANNINKPMVIVTSLYRFVSVNLPSDYYIFLPPDKSLYRLPMLISGETGEIQYLVEKG